MFKKIVDIVENHPHHLEVTDDMVEEIFNTGFNYGLFKEENSFFEKKNQVINLMSVLTKLNGKTFT